MNIFECRDALQQYYNDLDRRLNNSVKQEHAQVVGQILTLFNSAVKLHNLLPVHTLCLETTFTPEDIQNLVQYHQKLSEILDGLSVFQFQTRAWDDIYRNFLFARSVIGCWFEQDIHRYNCHHLFQRLKSSVQTNRFLIRHLKTHWLAIANEPVLQRYEAHIQFLMMQSKIPGVSTSEGECYGLCIGYAHHRSQGGIEPFIFNEAVALIQKNQQFKYHESFISFRKRLSGVIYEQDLMKQVKTICEYAQKHQEEHLYIDLYNETGGHMVYLHYTRANQWHFFDPNHGAFEFADEEKFRAFYQELYSGYLHRETLFYGFALSLRTATLPQNTWIGKLRSFLTGPAYLPGAILQKNIITTIILGASLLLGAALYGFFLTIFPAFGVATPILAVAASALVALWAYACADVLAQYMVTTGFSGLLAPFLFVYHRVTTTCSYLFESLGRFFKPTPSFLLLAGEEVQEPHFTSSMNQILEQLPDISILQGLGKRGSDFPTEGEGSVNEAGNQPTDTFSERLSVPGIKIPG